jgi:hypothetical protein
MIRIKGSAATYGDLWFGEALPRDPGVDIARYRCRAAPIARARCVPFLSLVTDLAGDEDAISGQFNRDCRYKVRRADSKDELLSEFITAPRSRLEEFRAFFDTFARQKAHEPCDPQWLRAACDADQLVFTIASRRGEALVWHAYATAGNATWLQYTGSCYRDRENDYRALVGRANRWLHWKDMLRFKELGVTRYDWGGLFEDELAPDRAGINDFKKSFGGRVERTYDCTVPVTLRGRIYLPLRDAWRKWKRPSSGPGDTAPGVAPRTTRA